MRDQVSHLYSTTVVEMSRDFCDGGDEPLDFIRTGTDTEFWVRTGSVGGSLAFRFLHVNVI